MWKLVGDAAVVQLLVAVAQACSLVCITVVAVLLKNVHQHANQLLYANLHLFANQHQAVVAASQVFWHVFAPRWQLSRAAVVHLSRFANQLQYASQLLFANQFVKKFAHQPARRVCWLA
jgi:hypothetical protein